MRFCVYDACSIFAAHILAVTLALCMPPRNAHVFSCDLSQVNTLGSFIDYVALGPSLAPLRRLLFEWPQFAFVGPRLQIIAYSSFSMAPLTTIACLGPRLQILAGNPSAHGASSMQHQKYLRSFVPKYYLSQNGYGLRFLLLLLFLFYYYYLLFYYFYYFNYFYDYYYYYYLLFTIYNLLFYYLLITNTIAKPTLCQMCEHACNK